MTDNKSRYLWRRASYDLTRQMQMQIMGQPHGNFTVYDTQDSLVAWWRLNENSTITTDVPGGTVIDDSGNGNHGSYYAEGSYVPTFTDQSSPMTNLFSHSIEFHNGSNELGYAKLGTTIGALSSADPDWNMYENSWTISIWCKRYDVLPAATEGYWLFVLAGDPTTNYGHVGVRIGTDNNLGLDISASHVLDGAATADIETSMDDTQWHLVTVTYSSTTTLFSFYMDGEIAGTKSEAHGLSTSDVFILGAELDSATSNADSGDSMWQGSIGAVGLWHTALSAENVTSLYSAHLGNIFELQRDYHIRGSRSTLTGSIDRFRQGASIKTLQQQQGGLIPKISSAGRTKLLFGGKEASDSQFDESRLTSDLESDRVTEVPTHEFDFRDLGQPKTYLDDGSYSDLAKYSSVDYLSIENYQLPTSLLDVSDYRLMEAAIEPLTIRTSISFSSTYHPFEAHDAWGALQGDYAEDVHRTYTKLTDKIDWRANLTWRPDADSWTPESSPHVAFSHAIPPFVDGQTTMTNHPSFFKGLPVTDDLTAGKSNLSLPGYVSEDRSAAYPFVDLTKPEALPIGASLRTGKYYGLAFDSGMSDAVFRMTDMDDTTLGMHRARTGFTFYHGTDSLAFGGRKPPRRWMRSYIDFDPRSPLSGSHEAQGTNPPAGSGRVDNYPVLTSGHDYPRGKQAVYLNDDWASSPENVLLKDWETNTWALVFAAEFLTGMNTIDKRWLQFRHKVQGSVKIKFDIVAASGNITYPGLKSYYLKTDGIDHLDPPEAAEDFAIQYSVDNGVTWVNAELYDHDDYNEDTYIHVSKLIQDPTGVGAPYLVRIAQMNFSGNLGTYDNYALRKVYLEERFGPITRSGLRSLPARLQLDERSNRLGRYPTIRRMGDHDRKGVFNIHFDDTNTVVFHEGRAKAHISFYDRPQDGAKLTFSDAMGNSATLEFNHGKIVAPGNVEVSTHDMDDDTGAVARSFISSIKKASVSKGLRMTATLAGVNGLYGQQPGSTTVVLTQWDVGTAGNTSITSTSSATALRHVVTGALGHNSAHMTHSFTGGKASAGGGHRQYAAAMDDTSNPWEGSNYGADDSVKEDHFYPRSSIQSGPLFTDVHDPYEYPFNAVHVTKGVVDANLKVSLPAIDDGLSPFNESRVPIEQGKFYREGTPESEIPGFSSRLASKTSIVIPFTVANDKHMYFSTGSIIGSNTNNKGAWGRPYEVNTGYGYFNWQDGTWGTVGVSDTSVGTKQGIDYIGSFERRNSGVLHSGQYDQKITANFTSSLMPFAPADIYHSDGAQFAKTVGNMVTSYGFPYGKQYHATGSFLLNISDYITRPFLLEKVSLEFSAEFEGSRYMSSSAGPIVKHFFLLNQHDVPGDANTAGVGTHPSDSNQFFVAESPMWWGWGTAKTISGGGSADLNVQWHTPYNRGSEDEFGKPKSSEVPVNRIRDLVWHGQISLQPLTTRNPNYPSQGYETDPNESNLPIAKFPKSYERDLNIGAPNSSLLRWDDELLPPAATVGDYLGPVSGTFTLSAPCRIEAGQSYAADGNGNLIGIQKIRKNMFVADDSNVTDYIRPEYFAEDGEYGQQHIAFKLLYNAAGTRSGLAPCPSAGRSFLRPQMGQDKDTSSGHPVKILDPRHIPGNPFGVGHIFAGGVMAGPASGSSGIDDIGSTGWLKEQFVPGTTSRTSPYMLLPGDKLALGFYASPSFFLAKNTPGTYYNKTAGSNEHLFTIEPGPMGSSMGYEDRLAEQRTTLKAGSWKLVLYGSLVKDGKEFHEGRNQPLTSLGVHEALHFDNPVLDQFQLGAKHEYEGTYTDSVINGDINKFDGGPPNVEFWGHHTRKIYGSHARGTAYLSGSQTKFVKLTSNSETYYDSMTPDPAMIQHFHNAQPAKMASSFKWFAGAQLILGEGPFGQLGDYGGNYHYPTVWTYHLPVNFNWPHAFPFEPKYSHLPRLVGAAFGVVETSAKKEIRNSPLTFVTVAERLRSVAFTYNGLIGNGVGIPKDIGDHYAHFVAGPDNDPGVWQNAYFGFGDGPNSLPRLGDTYDILDAGQILIGHLENRGFKYGLINGANIRSNAVTRHDRHGQFRDVLEQRHDTAYFTDGTIQDPPIKIKYIARDGTANVDPEMTNTSNLSLYSTSSLPYFDGFPKNRATLPPDEDEELITIA